MKRIVPTANPNGWVSTESMNPHKYYGVLSPAGEKSFITQEQYEFGHFIVRSPSGITHGNGYKMFTCKELGDLASMLIYNNFSVFEFDTWQELLQWCLNNIS